MRRVLKHYFIPHEGNAYKPHFFNRRILSLVSLFIVAVFGLSFCYSLVLSRIDYLASVLPSVLIDLANSDRSFYKFSPLTRNLILEEAAKEKAADMARYSYFAHISPAGVTPWYWFTKAGYRFIYAGENLAVNFNDSGAINQAWMNSPGHRANILNQQFTEIGIATAEGIYEGHPTTFVVQEFGRPSFAKATEGKPAQEPKVLPIGETNPPAGEAGTLIAVRNTEVPASNLQLPASSVVQSATQYATLSDKMLTSPQMLLGIIYFILIGIVLGAIFMSLAIEFKRHHGKHLLSGLALIALIVFLFYAYRHIAPGVVIL